jgi:uncharacterized membrane protein (UPF0127 family)
MSKKKVNVKSEKAKVKGQNALNKTFWNKRNIIILSVLVILIAASVYYFFIRKTEPKFVKGGEVTFIKTQSRETIRTIDVETAITPESQVQGLMYRTYMADSLGMLFIMADVGKHAFWMKNTYIALDIAFIDSTGTIDTIYRNAKPLSERSLPSRQRIKYILETNGGFSDKNGIKERDLISFKLIKK